MIRYPLEAERIVDFISAGFSLEASNSTSRIIDVSIDLKTNRFTLSEDSRIIAKELAKDDLAGLLLARTVKAFVETVSEGIVIAGAAVRKQKAGIIIPGMAGSGKSMLAAWLVSLGYHYLADKLVFFPKETRQLKPLVSPVLIKKPGFDMVHDLFPLVGKKDLVFKNENAVLISPKMFCKKPSPSVMELAMIIFPTYRKGTELFIEALSPARTGLQLMKSLANGLNIENHGFACIADISRRVVAIALTYGDFKQLDPVLDAVVASAVDHQFTPQEFIKFTQSFNRENPGGIFRYEKFSPPVPATNVRSVPTPTVFKIPKATLPVGKKRLAIGMATYDDYDGVYFSIQAIRMYHLEIMDDIEIIVADNHPEGPCGKDLKALDSKVSGYRYLPVPDMTGTAVRNRIFQEAESDYVLCIDCHVLIVPGALKRLMDYLDQHPDCLDLLQGPMLYDDLKTISTHFNRVWREGMYGVWSHDNRCDDPLAEPVEIPMQGLGLFGCRKDAWPGFNPRFRGFGGEEGYIHEKFRQLGRRTVCLPFLRWLHRFGRPMGIPYKVNWEDRIRNYMIGFEELGMHDAPIREHFSEYLGKSAASKIFEKIDHEMQSPFHYFDAIYCITKDKDSVRYQRMLKRFHALGISERVRMFQAVVTPENHHIGCGLSHRSAVFFAKKQGLQNVLVLEDDAIFLDRTNFHLSRSIAELKKQAWNVFYLGGHKWGQKFFKVKGCRFLDKTRGLTCAHALAYNNTVFNKILTDIPDNIEQMRVWVQDHLAIDQYLRGTDNLMIASPVVASQIELLGQEKAEHRGRFTLGN